MDSKCLIPGDATLIENIVNYLKAKGIFDEFRQECLADVDTKSSYQNLSQRIDGYSSKFLANEAWHPDSNKNELRNKLRRNINESGTLAIGADIVVDQVFKPKIPFLFSKITEVVHQYVKEQSEPGATLSSESSLTSEKSVSDASENKTITKISDPIADILSFSNSKSKASSAAHGKTDNVQPKLGDISKVEKKKERKNITTSEKSMQEVQGVATTTSVKEAKVHLEKDKVKKEDPEIQQVHKKIIKDEVKSEKKKTDDIKVSVDDIATQSEEGKSSVPVSFKPNVLSKKDEKSKHKSKSQNIHKSTSSSNEIKKPKKESCEKSVKPNKSKPTKSSKESSLPIKINSSLKNKEEKGESSKSKSFDVGCNKISESSVENLPNYNKKDSNTSKHKNLSEKADKAIVSKSIDKNEPHIHHDSSNEKDSKFIQRTSSCDSSQGSDQEKNVYLITEKERTEHFSKHANKEKFEHADNSNEIDKKSPSSSDEIPSKTCKIGMDVKLKLKDTLAVEEAKINSRSDSFGSTSSVSCSSNASKDNLIPNFDDLSEISENDKKKEVLKKKDSCQNSFKTLPPPSPPPPSSSLTSDLTSSAEMDDTQFLLSDSETSSNEKNSEESSSDSELECKDLINDTLNENALNSSTDNINAFYDIFLYSSSSSEFEGYGDSPEKRNTFNDELKNIHESDISLSSVHTSDLSSFDDELSSDEEVALLTSNMKKRLTLKEAQEIIENRAAFNIKKEADSKSSVDETSFSGRCSQRSSFISSDDELPPSEPKRLLRRERKLNPRYSSSEYTSIFNCKKETFITKQSSSFVISPASTPRKESKLKKRTTSTEQNEIVKDSFEEAKTFDVHQDEVEISEKIQSKLKKESQDEDDQLSVSKETDEIESITDKEQLFKENNKNNLLSVDDRSKDHEKLKPHKNSNLKGNSHSPKRKLEATESTTMKRPCNRNSGDLSNFELAANENKPFNSEKNYFHEEKRLNDSSLKESNLTTEVKKDLFCKRRITKNGGIVGQKSVFSKNSHSKVINYGDKKNNESGTSKELNSL